MCDEKIIEAKVKSSNIGEKMTNEYHTLQQTKNDMVFQKVISDGDLVFVNVELDDRHAFFAFDTRHAEDYEVLVSKFPRISLK